MAAAFFALPAAARANCDVPETPNGIPEEVAFKADVGGVRAALARSGIGVGGGYFAEPFYNWGGFDEGGEYQGVLELYVNADMNKLGFWKGLCFHANGFQIHGNSITAANIGALMPVTSLEATDATRLFELWLEQTIIKDKLTVRVGQLAADEEFILSDGGGYFINGTWGWPSITAADRPIRWQHPAFASRSIRTKRWDFSSASITATRPLLAPTRTRSAATITGSTSSWTTTRC
jgi:porin